ncbi:MAG: ABC transporter ATP-binding protein [Actinomycetota bacterium]
MFGGGGQGAWMLMRHGRSDELEKGYKLAPGTVSRALKLAGKYKFAIIWFLAVTVGAGFLGAVPPLLLRALVDKALPPRHHDSHLVLILAIAGVAVAVVSAAANLASRYLSSRVGEGLIFDLRSKLFDHVQRMPIAFFTRTQTGALISRLNNDVVGAQSAMTGTLGSVVTSLITVATTVAVMLYLNWELTLLALALLPAFVIPSKRVGKRLQRITREQMGLNAAMNATMQERFNVSGAMVAKLFGRPDSELEGFSDRAGRVRDIGVKIAVYSRTLFVTLALVSAVGTAVVIYVGGRLALSGRLTTGDVVAFVAYVGSLYAPLTLLTNSRVDLMTSFVSFERVFEVLDLPHAIADAPDAVPLEAPRGRIEFKDVRFRYPRGQEVSLPSLEMVGSFDEEAASGEVLHGVSFVAEPGMTVALVGPSGAGKTTISNLIPRMYDATSGAVEIDGYDVRSVTMQSLRDAIGVVAQDPHLFHDTIRNNLRYARPHATDEQLVAACRDAQIYELIASLPDGLDTVVGERGYRLSGGEKQRLAIARVLLKAPAIVILDEATSHLDSESEVLIQRALAAALESRTSVVIAHRLSTIVNADMILVVEDGRIVQSGRHRDLVGIPGTYADLYTTQFARAGTA